MLKHYQLKDNKQKLAVMRAFLLLKQNPNFAIFADFLDEVIDGTTDDLRTLPLDHIAQVQGRAQLAVELKEMFSMADEPEIRRLLTQTQGQ